MWYFLGIVSILRFSEFFLVVDSSQYFDTPILSLCFQEYWKYYLSSVDVSVIGQTMLKPGGHGSVMVKYHTIQTRGQGFEPLCKHFLPNFQRGLSPM